MAFVPAVLVAAGIAVLSLTEVRYMSSVQVNDKLAHGFLYLVLAVAWLIPVLRTSHARAIPYISVCAAATAYGALMEILQRFCTITRSGEMADLFADFIGALLGVLAVFVFEISRSRNLDISK